MSFISHGKRQVAFTPEPVDVPALPRRVAHAVHALMYASTELGMPPTAGEVCVFDSEAPSVRSTAAALREGQKQGLCANARGYWVASMRANEYRSDFEKRFLDDTNDEKE